MNNPNNTDSNSEAGLTGSRSTSSDEPKRLSQESRRSRGEDGSRWLDSVRAATTHNFDNAADASADFARNNPWKMMGICVAAGVALGVLIGLR